MKILGIIIFSLLLVVVGASLIQADSGYVMIRFQDFRIELNLVLFVLLSVVLLFAFYWLLRFLKRTFSSRKDFKKWQEHRNLVNTQKNLSKGFIALGEGEYRKAQKILTKVADKSKEPLVPLLAAANAAQQQGDNHSCEFLLNKAKDVAPDAKYALTLAQAEQNLTAGELDKAQDILLKLGNRFKNNPVYLRLQAQIYLRSENWDQLIALLPKLKSKSNLSVDDLKELEHKAHRHQLLGARNQTEVNNSWKQIPRQLKTDKAVAVDFVHKLVETEQEAAAARHIVSMLNDNWDDDLANLYAQLDLTDVTTQIKNLENWLESQPDNYNLHYGLGKLYSKKQLWVMAKESLELSLKHKNTPEARALLADATEHILEHENQ